MLGQCLQAVHVDGAFHVAGRFVRLDQQAFELYQAPAHPGHGAAQAHVLFAQVVGYLDAAQGGFQAACLGDQLREALEQFSVEAVALQRYLKGLAIEVVEFEESGTQIFQYAAQLSAANLQSRPFDLGGDRLDRRLGDGIVPDHGQGGHDQRCRSGFDRHVCFSVDV
ncbi:hypothetical protein OF001_U20054 [Pseudomonas sp. OF001]|nr:hypothetical protein OF001_U20054 [Pseudomonas sp. OF001]